MKCTAKSELLKKPTTLLKHLQNKMNEWGTEQKELPTMCCEYIFVDEINKI